MNKQLAVIMLTISALLWGGGFVVTKMAMDMGVSTGILNMFRGGIFALLVYIIFNKQVRNMSKQEFKIGFSVGTLNCVGFILQSLGALYTIPSHSSFLSTTNVVMVPFLVWIVYKIKPKIKNYISVTICLLGMAILSGVFASEFIINKGDVYSIICAVFFAMSIVLLSNQPENGHFASSAFLMGLTLFVGSFIYFIVVEKAFIPNIDWQAVIIPILYMAIGSNFIAQIFQIISQKYLNASTASLIILLEGIFGSIFSIMFGFELITINLFIGGALILISLAINEIEFK